MANATKSVDAPLSAAAMARSAPSRNHRGPFGLPAAWTDEKVDRLRHLWSDPSFSANAIAKALGGGITRSAVLGKVRRLGLESRAGIPAMRQARTPGTVVQFRAGTKRAGKVEGKTSRDAAPAPKRRLTIEDWLRSATQDFEDLQTEASPFAVTIGDLAAHHCRWPIGGEFYCGAPGADVHARRPYCTIHSFRARRQGDEADGKKRGRRD